MAFHNSSDPKSQHANRVERLNRSLEARQRLGDSAGATQVRKSIEDVKRQGPNGPICSPRVRGGR